MYRDWKSTNNINEYTKKKKKFQTFEKIIDQNFNNDAKYFYYHNIFGNRGSKQHSLQAVELSQWTQAAVQIVSNLPQQWGPDLPFFGMPAMRTRWMAGTVAHKSG